MVVRRIHDKWNAERGDSKSKDVDDVHNREIGIPEQNYVSTRRCASKREFRIECVDSWNPRKRST